VSEASFIEDFNINDLISTGQQQFYIYWNEVKGSRIMPSRSDINPNDFVDILPNILIFDYLEQEDDFIIRLTGTKNSQFLGETTGERLSTMEQYADAAERLKWCVKSKQPYYIKSTLESIDKEYIKYASIVMPLSDDNENVNMIILSSHFY